MNEAELLAFEKRHLTPEQAKRFDELFLSRKKSKKLTYALWALGGVFGLHRFYLGNYGTGLIVFAVTIFTGGLGAVVGLYDVVNIERLMIQANRDLLLQTIKDVKRK